MTTTEDFKRKLTAILSADVEGYSRLMGQDEDSTIRTLTAYRALMSNLIQKHRGRVVDTPGDNLLAEFGSVMDAVRCAVEIQEELRIRNAELPENRQMQFRIGINLGDIIEEGDHIYGDGVNIAARVEGLAEGGGICVSGSVYDSIRNKLSWSYDFLGEHTVKNIKEPVRIYRIRIEPEAATKKTGSRTWQWAALSVAAIIILGAVVYIVFDKFYLDRRAAEISQVPAISDIEKSKKTIAVLPFENLSSDPEQVYFVDGLSEEILNSITKISDIRVIARTSSFSFKGTNKTVQEIASVLGADHILEGSVRKAGNALRITAQLIQASDGTHLWSETYDRELKDIFAIQEDIATAVANELKATLGIGKSLKQLGGTDNLEAYERYLIALGQMPAFNIAILNQVQELIDEAIALDPEFALAWSLKANIHIFKIVSGPPNRANSEMDEGLHAVQKAIELEPNLPEAYISLGAIKMNSGEWIEAESAFRNAFQLSAESILTDEMQTMVVHYLGVGNFKRAHEYIEEMRRKDPLNERIRYWYVYSLNLMGDTQRAEEEYERGRELFGDKWWGAHYYILSMASPGVKLPVPLDEIPETGGPYRYFSIVWEHFGSPEKGLIELHRIYDDDENLSSQDIIGISWCAAYLGDSEFALEAMEKTYYITPSNTFHFWSPVFHELRQTPRFKVFVKKIGLVDYWNRFDWPDICRPLENGDFECK